MPLRDHFRPPTSKTASWEAVHGGWPMVIVQSLGRSMPRRYVAEPRVPIDDCTVVGDDDNVPTPDWTPTAPTFQMATDLLAQDKYEVRVYDAKHGRRLVAAIEIVSPANKDRPENRRAFAAKCVALLQNQVSVTIVDLVTVRSDNLYSELLDLIGQTDPALGTAPSATYTVACRATKRDPKPGTSWQLETWLKPLQIGQPLPTLPLWLADNFAVSLDLEESYEQTCKALRIS